MVLQQTFSPSVQEGLPDKGCLFTCDNTLGTKVKRKVDHKNNTKQRRNKSGENQEIK